MVIYNIVLVEADWNVVIPCLTCPTWGQGRNVYLLFQYGQVLQEVNAFHILISYYKIACCTENSVDPDQLASSCSGSTLFTIELISCLARV